MLKLVKIKVVPYLLFSSGRYCKQERTRRDGTELSLQSEEEDFGRQRRESPANTARRTTERMKTLNQAGEPGLRAIRSEDHLVGRATPAVLS